MNRALRRAAKANAKQTAAVLASRVYDFQGGAVVRVTDGRAIEALTRAFMLLLRFEGRPVAVPLSEAEVMGFPAHKRACLPGGVTWLAVGLDPEMRASYALQSAAGPDRAAAHEAARELALARLTGLCATPGFPMGPPRGRA